MKTYSFNDKLFDDELIQLDDNEIREILPDNNNGLTYFFNIYGLVYAAKEYTINERN